jgi:hypothetical protein
VDRLTFAGNIPETGTASDRLAHTRAQRDNEPLPNWRAGLVSGCAARCDHEFASLGNRELRELVLSSRRITRWSGRVSRR